MGKVHGSLARAGKVRGQTPKVAKQDKKKKPRGRAHKRMQYNRRFVTAASLSKITGVGCCLFQSQLRITFGTIMTEFMASKTLYLGLVIMLISSSAFAFKMIVIGFEMPAAISIASISSSSTSTSTPSSRIRGMNIGGKEGVGNLTYLPLRFWNRAIVPTTT
ncbi:hypothetical protein RJ639_014459 [Escallonia herrerae]|uniref:40S ribosomal protein S30 n=1 Tax=Escallonia herrerae TaxID=1293975 RepID=A0AA88VL79_9ASTE|nr:hypothetical protein RJ639_014459 [Escallonia herrerae]